MLWGFIKTVIAVDDDTALKIYKRLAFDGCCNQVDEAVEVLEKMDEKLVKDQQRDATARRVSRDAFKTQ